MPLSEQENQCIERACEFLSSAIGGRWKIESHLDELYVNEPTPEVKVTNGETTAAIEVKWMAGSLAQQAYRQSLLSNKRRLVPSCGGYYYLQPPIDLHPPINNALYRQVKRDVERVAPALHPEDEGVLHIPRSGYISLISERNPPWIHCLHAGGFSDLFRPILERLRGRFMLVDAGIQHSFFTDEGKEAFYSSIVSACERRLEGDSSTFSWNEEWQITRLEDNEEGEKGVWILASDEARSVQESIEENLKNLLDNALRKFVKRWAQIHILVLEENIKSHTPAIQQIVGNMDPTQLPNIDYVLLVINGRVIQCYPQLANLDTVNTSF